jgi:hypothetical protein
MYRHSSRWPRVMPASGNNSMTVRSHRPGPPQRCRSARRRELVELEKQRLPALLEIARGIEDDHDRERDERGQGGETPGRDGSTRPLLELSDAGREPGRAACWRFIGWMRANRSETPIRSLTMW